MGKIIKAALSGYGPLQRFIFSAIISLVLLAAPVFAADSGENISQALTLLVKPPDGQKEPMTDLYDKAAIAVESISMKKELATIPQDSRVVILHNPANADPRLPPEVYKFAEQILIKKILNSRQVLIVECPECELIAFPRGREAAVAGPAEISGKMAVISEKLNLDSWLVWNLYIPGNGRAFFNIRLVEAKSGTVKWFRNSDDKSALAEEQREQAELVRKDVRYTVYTSLWGYGVRRTLAAGGKPEAVTADRILVLGSKLIHYQALSESVGYGMGMEIFSNVTGFSYADIMGLDMYGQLQYHLDAPVVERDTGVVYSKYNYYLSLGEMYVNGTVTEIFKTGFEVKFSPKLSVALGIVYFKDGHVWLADNPNYTAGGEIGGLTYDISFGWSY